MPILIDGHVHIYPVFPIDRFLDAAWHNFTRAAVENDLSHDATYVLALTENKGNDVFARLKQQADSSSSSFNFFSTGEPESLIASKGEIKLILIAGRQIISKENLELLSLLSTAKIEDHTLSLAELAATVAENGGLPVLPWGVGKWWGARGKVIGNLLNSSRDFPLFVGDNGNRPSFWPMPALLRHSQNMHIPLLSGSDPLPLSSHLNRPGSSGIIIPEGEVSDDQPAASLRRLLTGKNEAISFGRRAGTLQFIIDQFKVNLQKQLSTKLVNK